MAHLKKVILIQLPSGVIKFVPIEDIAKCDIIIPDEKTSVVVYEQTFPGESIYDPGLEDSVKVRNITDEDIAIITAHNRECFVEVDYKDELSMPSNGRGFKMLVIHLTREEVIA
jgi:hypothetical protein